MDRIQLLDLIFSELKNGIGVEVGTFKGQFSKEILQRWNGKLYMVDVWNELGDEYIDASNHKNFENGVYSECMQNIKGYEDRGIMIRATSKVASDLFEDGSLDFVYIDANHAYDYVKEDIDLWYPKVKSGGMVMGHDYLLMDWNSTPHASNGIDKHIWTNNGNGGEFNIYAGIFGVNPAVDEFCKKNDYKSKFTSEWFSTWYFIKK
jgi:hypothetical protein